MTFQRTEPPSGGKPPIGEDISAARALRQGDKRAAALLRGTPIIIMLRGGLINSCWLKRWLRVWWLQEDRHVLHQRVEVSKRGLLAFTDQWNRGIVRRGEAVSPVGFSHLIHGL